MRKVFDEKVRLTFVSVRKKLSDPDGMSAKAVIDGIVRAGILHDDTAQQVDEIRYRQIKGKEESTLVIIETAKEKTMHVADIASEEINVVGHNTEAGEKFEVRYRNGQEQEAASRVREWLADPDMDFSEEDSHSMIARILPHLPRRKKQHGS